MEQPIDKDTFIDILKRATLSALYKCEHYFKQKDFEKASWVFIKEIAITFSEFGHPDVRNRIESSQTIGFKTQEAFKTKAEIDELKKLIEKLFREEFFDYPEND